MPRYWETTTFLGHSLSAMTFVDADPEIIKRMMETWMKLDVYKHFGTEFLTGAGVGPGISKRLRDEPHGEGISSLDR